MCYFLCKNGKHKQTNTSTQAQSKNQHDEQPGDSSTNTITVNQSYGKLTPVTASFDEDPQQDMYEPVNVC